MGRISRAIGKARRDGVRAVFARAWALLRRVFYLREQHVWYQLDLAAERPRRELVEEARLVRADEEQLAKAVELGQSLSDARVRKAAGNDLWLALDEQDRALFACWTFRTETPVLAARGGMLSLPAGTACLEDSVASPHARGKGIAPASWTLIADTLQREGFESMITKVATSNAPSRKAVEKAGFREIAVMDVTRIGPRQQVAMASMGGVADALARSLGA